MMENASEHGLLVMNHEYINPTFLHPKGPTKPNGRRTEDEVIREVNAHGVSVVHIKKDKTNQKVEIVQNSIFNRRITGSTIMDFNGPVAGNPLLATQYSPVGSQNSRHTQQTCGNGYTPWGTYLTTEENFIGYFQTFRCRVNMQVAQRKEKIALKRYGLGLSIDYLYEKNADGTPEERKGQIIYLL